MTREEYKNIILQASMVNKAKAKQTAKPAKYPQGFFHAKNCRHCGKSFLPKAPSEHYCSDACKDYAHIESYYMRVYGLTIEDYLDIAEKQNFVCAICGQPNFAMGEKHSGALVVDHNHETGKVRGLLCHNCNRALGLLKDNPDTIGKCLAYILSNV